MGRPIGNVNREKPFNEALRTALRGDPLRLRRIAEKLADSEAQVCRDRAHSLAAARPASRRMLYARLKLAPFDCWGTTPSDGGRVTAQLGSAKPSQIHRRSSNSIHGRSTKNSTARLLARSSARPPLLPSYIHRAAVTGRFEDGAPFSVRGVRKRMQLYAECFPTIFSCPRQGRQPPSCSSEGIAALGRQRVLSRKADAVICADPAGTIIRWNRASTALFDHSAEEALGQGIDVIIPEHLRAAHRSGFDAAMTKGALKLQGRPTLTRALHKSRRRLYVEMTFALVKGDAESEVLGAVAAAASP